MAAAAFQSFNSTNTGVGNLTVDKPTGTQAGDILIAALSFEKGSLVAITPPSGWALIPGSRINGGTDNGAAMYEKVAGGSEPANYTFTLTENPKRAGGIARYSGGDAEDVVDVVATSSGASSQSHVAPSVTTSGDERRVLVYHACKKPGTYTPAGGTTERWDAPNTAEGQPSNMLADYEKATAGATGTKTATCSEAEVWQTITVALNPEAGGGQKKTLTPATEADAAQPLSFQKPIKKTLTPATEAATAIARTATHKLPALTPATETGAAVALTQRKRATFVPAVEADAALAVGLGKLVDLEPATESDAAVAITFEQGGPQDFTLTPATEGDAAVAAGLLKRRTLTAATEAASAVALSVDKVLALVPAVEASVALAPTMRKLHSLAVAVETDAAQPILVTRPRTLSPATETDSARPLAARKRIALSAAQEADSAVAISYGGKYTLVTLDQAAEAGVAVPISARKRVTLGPVTEVSAGVPLAIRRLVTLGLGSESDTALTPGVRRRVALTPATGTDAAQPLTAFKRLTLVPATEADQTPNPGLFKALTLTPTTETDAAVVLSVKAGGGHNLMPAMEVDAALAIAWLIGQVIPPSARHGMPVIQRGDTGSVIGERSGDVGGRQRGALRPPVRSVP